MFWNTINLQSNPVRYIAQAIYPLNALFIKNTRSMVLRDTLSVFMLTLLSSSAMGQLVIDTLSSHYKLVYKNSLAQYQYKDAHGAQKVLDIPSEYQREFLLNDPGVRTSEKIKPGRENIFYQGKIYSLEDFKTVCPSSFDKVYGEVESSFVVSKNDSCFLLNIETCNLTFIHQQAVEDLILVYNYQTIQVYNEYEKSLTVYDAQGTLLGKIDLKDYYYSPIDNGYFIRLGLDESSLTQKNFQNRIVNNKGDFITEGKIIAQGKDVLAIEKKSGQIDYYFKDKKIEMPEGTQSFYYDRGERFCTIIKKDKNSAIFSLDFTKELIPARYKSIDYLSITVKVKENYQTSYKHYGNGEFYFQVIDVQDQLHIFDFQGKEIVLDKTYKNAKVNHVGLSQLDFFTITDMESNTHIYNRNWKYMATENDQSSSENTNNVLAKYYYLYEEKAANPLTLTHFKDELQDNTYFIFNNRKGGQNIFNNDFEPLLSKDYKSIKQISDTQFIISSKGLIQLNASDGHSTIIELKSE